MTAIAIIVIGLMVVTGSSYAVFKVKRGFREHRRGAPDTPENMADNGGEEL